MQIKLIHFVNASVGWLLLVMTMVLFISSKAGPDVILPHAPLFGISLGHLFCIAGGICLVMALVALWKEPTFMKAMLMAWLATSLAVYSLGCLWHGGRGLGGYLGNFSDAFGVSIQTSAIMANGVLACLIIGSYFVLLGLWLQKRRNHGQAS
jgi:hypothetical protein